MDSGRPRLHRDNIPAARQLRKRMTASEAMLWSHVRDRQFHGMKFRRQHPVGRFVLDFFCEDLLIAIEIDGGIHLDLAVAAADAERQRLLEELYIRFYRWSAAEVERDCERLLADLAVELQFTKAPLLPGWEKGSGDEGPAAREETVMEYSIVIHNAEEGGYWAEVPALEGCYAQGETIEETLEDMKGAIETHIEFLIEDGGEIPKGLGLRVERVTVSVPSAA